MKFITLLLTTPDANSRFVYLLHGLATAIGIVALSFAYVLTHNAVERDGYVSMMMVLLGGGSLSSVARAYNKKAGDAGTPPAQNDTK